MSFKDACLVLVGHGSTANEDSSASIRLHAETIRRRNLFAQVRTGYLKEAPTVETVIAAMSAPRIFIVPLFMSEGYFAEEIVPRRMGFNPHGDPAFERLRRRGSQLFLYCQPVGTHQAMTQVILSRAQAVVETHPFPRKPPMEETTLFVAGHGTPKNPASRRSIEHQVNLIKQSGLYAGVRAVFMEEPPRIADVYSMAKTRNVVVVPFFLSDGLHVCEDIPVLLGEREQEVKKRLAQGKETWRNPTERNGKHVWYSAAVGTDPVLAEVILERVTEAAAWLSDVQT